MMSRIKKLTAIFILTLLSVCFLPTAAFGASSASYSAEKVDYSAELRSDGSVAVSEDWRVAIGENSSESFTRKIPLTDDVFGSVSGISDIVVSVDGSVCSEESSDSLRRLSYSLIKNSDAYIIKWYMPEDNAPHTFSVRYVLSGGVKLYNDEAYFTFNIVNGDEKLLCNNITAVITAPSDCFAEDFQILESGSLAGEKSDGKITFSCKNSVGKAGGRIKLPSTLFDKSSLVQIVDDTRGIKIAVVVISVLAAAAIGFLIYFVINYKRIFRKHFIKKCRAFPREENASAIFDSVFFAFSPAQVLNIVIGDALNGADFFIITCLDLVKRGYIKASRDGFTADEKSETDRYNRPLNSCEKRVIEIFGGDEIKKFTEKPLKFYNEITSFNKQIKFVSPFFALSKNGKKLIYNCFEIRISAKQFEFVSPMEISDSFFRNDKYDVGDLAVSVINEFDKAENFGDICDPDEFKRNMFMLRDIYDRGERIFEKNEQKRKNKKR